MRDDRVHQQRQFSAVTGKYKHKSNICELLLNFVIIFFPG